jgi:hypothetical protein
MGDISGNVYTSQNKKNFIFTMLGETVILLCFFAYFLCVTAAYSEDMHGPEQPEEVKEEPAAAPAKPPSEKPAAPAEDAPAGDAPEAEPAAAE